MCHFSQDSDCNGVVLYAWPFVFSYIVFYLSAIKFLILTQSSVFTVATMTVALPMSGIWWSLFSSKDGLQWHPVVSGELVCSLLGLPIIIIGLGLFCKYHWLDQHFRRAGRSQLT